MQACLFALNMFVLFNFKFIGKNTLVFFRLEECMSRSLSVTSLFLGMLQISDFRFVY